MAEQRPEAALELQHAPNMRRNREATAHEREEHRPMMDIAISARRESGNGLVWLAHCDGRRAWVTSVFPSERRLRERGLRKSRTLVGEFPTSDAAFRAAWDSLMGIPDRGRT